MNSFIKLAHIGLSDLMVSASLSRELRVKKGLKTAVGILLFSCFHMVGFPKISIRPFPDFFLRKM